MSLSLCSLCLCGKQEISPQRHRAHRGKEVLDMSLSLCSLCLCGKQEISPQRHRAHRGKEVLDMSLSLCSLCLCGKQEISPQRHRAHRGKEVLDMSLSLCSLCLCGKQEISPQRHRAHRGKEVLDMSLSLCSLCLCGSYSIPIIPRSAYQCSKKASVGWCCKQEISPQRHRGKEVLDMSLSLCSLCLCGSYSIPIIPRSAYQCSKKASVGWCCKQEISPQRHRGKEVLDMSLSLCSLCLCGSYSIPIIPRSARRAVDRRYRRNRRSSGRGLP
ncbi:MAG: hypothetical protein KatS3mg058_0163 [Roseiflexus sp.]|nr:MAG: hypothetical protein KatS3mg058_0163 [Roseiflexus sp.]